MTTDTNWLKELKAGDRILLSSSYSRWYSEEIVKSVSAKRGDITLECGKVFSKYGSEKGVTWNGAVLVEYTQEHLDYSNAIKKRHSDLAIVKGFNFSKLSNADLAKVAELLKGR